MSIIAHEGAMHQDAAPSVVFLDAIAVDARRHLRTIDAISSSLVAQFAPASLINAICDAALAVENDLRAKVDPAPDHLHILNMAIHAAGEWLFVACDSAYDATQIERSRAILKDILRATPTPALEMQIAGAILVASGLLIHQSGSAAEIAALQRSVADVLGAVSVSTLIVQEAS